MHKTEIARGFQEVLLVEGREHYRIFHLTSQQTRKAGRAGAISHILEQGAGDLPKVSGKVGIRFRVSRLLVKDLSHQDLEL